MKTTKQNTDVCLAKLHVHTEALLLKVLNVISEL